MCGLKMEIISTASLVIMKGSFFNKKCVKKWWQFTLNKFIVKFKTLHFKSIIQCKGA